MCFGFLRLLRINKTILQVAYSLCPDSKMWGTPLWMLSHGISVSNWCSFLFFWVQRPVMALLGEPANTFLSRFLHHPRCGLRERSAILSVPHRAEHAATYFGAASLKLSKLFKLQFKPADYLRFYQLLLWDGTLLKIQSQCPNSTTNFLGLLWVWRDDKKKMLSPHKHILWRGMGLR